MYNQKQKLRYLEQCKYEETTIEAIKVCFNAVAPVEAFYQRDLSEFVQPQIDDMLRKINSKSRGYLTSICIFFSDYYNWCLSEGLIIDVVNKYDISQTRLLIENIIPAEMLNDKYFNKKRMLKYIEKIYDVTNRFIVYAIYLGIKGDKYEELKNIRLRDLDRETKTLKLITDRVIKVDDVFVDLINQADKATFYDEDGSTSIDKFGYYGYIDSEYVLKPVNRSHTTLLTSSMMKTRLGTIKKQSENEYFTVPTIFKNGLINHIIERHREVNPTLDLEKILLDKINNKLYTYDLDTQKYIDEFGSSIKVRMLRKEIADYIQCFQ